MKTIAYYISDYGYGHATRSVAIIRDLLKQYNRDVKIIVFHTYALNFLKDALKELPVEFISVHTDIGYILQSNSIEPDQSAMEKKYKKFVNEWESIGNIQKRYLLQHGVDLVVTDISPLPLITAKELDIPTVGISNFSWFTAYKDLVDTKHLDLAASKEPNWGKRGNENYGFISREVNSDEVSRIENLVNPLGDKTIVYYGLGMKVELEHNLNLWDSDNCAFLVSNNVEINRANVFKIPRDYTESQNYIAAADIIITKAGWSTVGEAVVHNKPLVILERNNMTEDNNTINYLRQLNRINTVKWKELIDFKITKDFIRKLSCQSNDHMSNDVDGVVSSLIEILSLEK